MTHQSQWRPAPRGLRAFCTAMPIIFVVLAASTLVFGVPYGTGGWSVGQEVLCAVGFLVLAGLLLWTRRLVVNGYVDLNVAVRRAKLVRYGAFGTGVACLVGLVPIAVGDGPSALPIMFTVYVMMSVFLIVSGMRKIPGVPVTET